MNKYIFIIFLFLFSGCAKTEYVKYTFPDAPENLLDPCPKLYTADESDPKLSNLLDTVMKNYELYEECSIKHELFIQWYNEQKINYKNTNK